VGLENITTGEPLISVVRPGSPDARDRGMVVADGKIKNGVLFMIVVIAPGILAGEVGTEKVVAEGIIR
jgi:hypothetical protein